MSSEDIHTPHNQCYVCWAYAEGDPNNVPQESGRVDSVQNMGSFAVLDNQVDYNPPLISNTSRQNHLISSVSGSLSLLEQQQIISRTAFQQGLHVVPHVSNQELQDLQALQLQYQNRSIQDASVGVRRSFLERQTIHSTSPLLPQLQNQIEGSLGPLGTPEESGISMFVEDQTWDNQQIRQLYMQASPVTSAQMYLFQQDQNMLMQQRLQQMGAPEQCLPQQQVYVPGTCAKLLAQYMHMQQQKSNGRGIEFWCKLVAEFFAPHAKERWCFSLCKEGLEKTSAVSQRMWHCEICNLESGCGYEVTAEVLPTLFNIKYDSGVVQELLYVDIPGEYLTTSGEVVVDYEKATSQTVYESLRIIRDGHLRIVFTPDLKIRSWDFCVRNIEQLIPCRTIVPQLQFLTRKYQITAQNSSSSLHSEELNKCSDMLTEAACGFPNALNLSLLADMGSTKKYVRGLEISEVVDCMTDLIDHSLKTGMSPRMSLCVLGGSSNQSGGPKSDNNPNKRQKRQPVQQEVANNNNVEPETVLHPFHSGGLLDAKNNHTNSLSSSYACSSSRVPFTESSAAPSVAQVVNSSPLETAALSSSFDYPGSSSFPWIWS